MVKKIFTTEGYSPLRIIKTALCAQRALRDILLKFHTKIELHWTKENPAEIENDFAGFIRYFNL